MNVVYPSLLAFHFHGGGPTAANWRARVGGAGLEVLELGTAPGTLYFLARKPLHAAGAGAAR
jgi:hypothetical protein